MTEPFAELWAWAESHAEVDLVPAKLVLKYRAITLEQFAAMDRAYSSLYELMAGAAADQVAMQGRVKELEAQIKALTAAT